MLNGVNQADSLLFRLSSKANIPTIKEITALARPTIVPTKGNHSLNIGWGAKRIQSVPNTS